MRADSQAFDPAQPDSHAEGIRTPQAFARAQRIRTAEGPRRWRLLETEPGRGAWNMAVDAMLMDAVRGGAEPVLRFYRWRPACLSLGRNQPARGEYEEERLRAHALDVVRRPTGGRAVLHDRELTYSAVFPDRALGSARRAYAAVNRALVAGLRRLGVAAELQPALARRAAAPSLAPCFREPAEGEVVVAGRKLIGSAQYRENGVILQHGSLLLDDSQSLVPSLLSRPARMEEAPPATLREVLGVEPGWEALTRALSAGWMEVLAGELQPRPLTTAELRQIGRFEGRYSDAAWTWRL